MEPIFRITTEYLGWTCLKSDLLVSYIITLHLFNYFTGTNRISYLTVETWCWAERNHSLTDHYTGSEPAKSVAYFFSAKCQAGKRKTPSFDVFGVTRSGWWEGGSGLKSAFNLSRSHHQLLVGFGGAWRCMRVYVWWVNLDRSSLGQTIYPRQFLGAKPPS